MRGADTINESLFTLRQLEDFIPAGHPLRAMRLMVNAALVQMDALFCGIYEADIKGGRPSIAPEKLMRAMLLQVLYSIRSERQLKEQTQYNLLLRWFVGLSMGDAIVEPFSVDGTLIQAWASHKSFVHNDGQDEGNEGGDGGNFKGQGRSNETHASTTDADARLYCKGDNASRLRFMGHTLSESRYGLLANAQVTTADCYAEREVAKVMINDARQAAARSGAEITLGADKGYDAQEFIDACVEMKVVPHVAKNTSWLRSAVPDEIAASEGYKVSVQKRKLIEQGFGWAKSVGRMRQVMVRGLKRVDQMFVLTMAAYNLTRMRSLAKIRLQAA
jgi:transposase